jgi:hypothetical protein
MANTGSGTHAPIPSASLATKARWKGTTTHHRPSAATATKAGSAS